VDGIKQFRVLSTKFIVEKQKTEDRRQKTEDRRQKTEDRRQKTEDRRQKTDSTTKSVRQEAAMRPLFRIMAGAAVLVFVTATQAMAGLTLASGSVLQGEVIDRKGSKFPSQIRIVAVNDQTGDFVGEVAWTSLNSVHKIEGRIKGNTIVYKETMYIKQGSAHLNCEYALVYDGQSLQGRWVEPGVDAGSAFYTIQR
jgi:hypothetical protein